MDELNVSNNTNQQQSTSTDTASIMSNLTAVAPISSQVVDDFQPDPKWEFTPLEKASLDCIEMEAPIYDTDNNDHQLEQNIVSPSQDRDKLRVTSDNEESARTEQQEEPHAPTGENESHTRHDSVTKITQDLTDEIREFDSGGSDLQQMSNMSVVEHTIEDMDQGTVASEEIIENRHHVVVESNIVPSNNSLESAASSRIDDRSRGALYTSKTELKQAASEHYKVNDSKEETTLVNSASNFLCQASVDAQMEKVIDNVVELGGGHHFEQVFDRAEDEAKVLESIRREITSDRSSMEIMADVALQQLPLVTETITAPAKSKLSAHITDDKQASVEKNTSEKVSSEYDDLNTSSAKPQGSEENVKSDEITFEEVVLSSDTNGVKSDGLIFNAQGSIDQKFKIKETVVDEVSSSLSIPTDSEQIEPMVEEPPPPELNKQTVHDDRAKNVDITVEPVDKIDEHIKEIHLNPIIEEASSAGESDDNEIRAIHRASNQTKFVTEESIAQAIIHSTHEEESQVEVKSASSDVDQHSKPEPSRRRSARSKAKVVEEKDTEKIQKPEIKEKSGLLKGLARKQRKEEVEDIDNPIEFAEEKVDESTQGQKPIQDEETEHIGTGQKRVETQPEESIKHGEEDDHEIKAQPIQPVRSKRDRTSKKPAAEDSTPKEESVKRQAKRSRMTLDSDHNKSYEAAKNTPMIKLPTPRSRATISTSNPSTRPTPPSQKRKRSPSPDANDRMASNEKTYTCSECNFSTDRLNNLVFHYTKSYCPGKCQMVEVMKADIIKQQQTPKGNKNKRLTRS